VILEVALLKVRDGEGAQFEAAFREAEPLIASAEGYLTHELQRCVEVLDQYVLLVRWRRLEDHTVGFRGSAAYQEWKRLLHHFYEPFPTVEHYRAVGREGEA
jgi:heme-degrading monooxygenase HmoA